MRRNREGVKESDRGKMPARNDLLRISGILHLGIFTYATPITVHKIMRVSSPSIIVAESRATPEPLCTRLGERNHSHDGRGGSYLGKKARAEHSESEGRCENDIVARYIYRISQDAEKVSGAATLPYN